MISDKLLKYAELDNIAPELDESLLNKIGQRVIRGFNLDEGTRQAWLDQNKEAIKIAKQVMEDKATPWPGASNIKFPLIASAVMAFAARTYPEIVKSDKVVQVGIIGDDPTGEKEQIAKKLSDHMTYQLLIESPNWETDTDRLLTVLALLGVVYRKSYFDPFLQIPATDLCLPDKITVNDNAKSIESARRVTHQLELYTNDLIERMRLGIYCDIPISELCTNNQNQDEDELHDVLEQHCYWDLDDDDYQEPYIVTVHKNTGRVLRIVARFDLEDIIFNEKGKIARIPPVCHFTDYHFLRSPDGKFHSIGYGSLLYPINDTVNTTMNQMIDAGTLSNRQPGLISKQFRNIKGALTFRPGELKPVDVPMGKDIASNIYMLPIREPSQVLLSLTTMLLNAGKELASINDITEGQALPQNSPATTVLELLKQGLKIHKAIQKRLYRSLMKEFQKLARLNKLYLDEEAYFYLFTGQGSVRRSDYADQRLMVFPAADPALSSDAERLARAQALMQLKGDPNINDREVVTRFLQSLEVPQMEKILAPEPDPNAPPPPEVEKIISEADLNRAKARDFLVGREIEALRLQQTENTQQSLAAESAARVEKMHQDIIAKFAELELKFGDIVANFAIKSAEQEAQSQEGQEKRPPEQQIAYNAPDIAPVLEKLNAMQNPNSEQAPMPPEMSAEMSPEGVNPEGAIP